MRKRGRDREIGREREERMGGELGYGKRCHKKGERIEDKQRERQRQREREKESERERKGANESERERKREKERQKC